ncbi:PqqD family protein [Lusitaniella coriacea]|uniref:PqqD family protein n=1 Tax=Lusitaniella coriacea TaxID=1983105 RepID=UPI003CF5086A
MLSIELTQKIAPVEDVLMQNLADEAVLLNLQNEAYYGLDDVGTRMLTVLQGSESIKIAYQQLAEEYEVDPAVLKQDLLDFIEKLLEHGLVRLSE